MLFIFSETLDDWTKLPENLGLRREENKVQSIYPCSDYLNDPHAIPQINLRSVCGNMEQKLLKDFITMGKALLLKLVLAVEWALGILFGKISLNCPTINLRRYVPLLTLVRPYTH